MWIWLLGEVVFELKFLDVGEENRGKVLLLLAMEFSLEACRESECGRES